jgi:uncharacterized protein (TIGR02996 family)
VDPVEQRLRSAIRADPNDNHARRAYADWLLERADPYGELIAADLDGDDELVTELYRSHYEHLVNKLPGEASHIELARGMITAFRTERRIEDLLAPATVAELIALAPIPVVRSRPGNDVIQDILIRADGRVAAIIDCMERDHIIHRVDIIALPDRRVLAGAQHAVAPPMPLWMLAHGLHADLRFVMGRDALCYYLDGNHELVFAP